MLGISPLLSLRSAWIVDRNVIVKTNDPTMHNSVQRVRREIVTSVSTKTLVTTNFSEITGTNGITIRSGG